MSILYFAGGMLILVGLQRFATGHMWMGVAAIAVGAILLFQAYSNRKPPPKGPYG